MMRWDFNNNGWLVEFPEGHLSNVEIGPNEQKFMELLEKRSLDGKPIERMHFSWTQKGWNLDREEKFKVISESLEREGTSLDFGDRTIGLDSHLEVRKYKEPKR